MLGWGEVRKKASNFQNQNPNAKIVDVFATIYSLISFVVLVTISNLFATNTYHYTGYSISKQGSVLPTAVFILKNWIFFIEAVALETERASAEGETSQKNLCHHAYIIYNIYEPSPHPTHTYTIPT